MRGGHASRAPPSAPAAAAAAAAHDDNGGTCVGLPLLRDVASQTDPAAPPPPPGTWAHMVRARCRARQRDGSGACGGGSGVRGGGAACQHLTFRFVRSRCAAPQLAAVAADPALQARVEATFRGASRPRTTHTHVHATHFAAAATESAAAVSCTNGD
jgi:hypothetical protein